MRGLPIGQPYGYDPNYGGNTEHFHYGIDWPCPIGTPVYAPCDGTVVVYTQGAPFRFPGVYNGAWGNYLEIEWENGLNVGLCHLTDSPYARGDRVEQGWAVAHSGNTGLTFGPHVHLQLVDRANSRRPDPTPFLVSGETP